MRKLIKLALICSVLAGGVWLWNTQPDIRESILQYVENGDFLTLEARYTPEQIINTHRKELLSDSKHKIQDYSTRFSPYLYIEAKYTGSNKRTQEGIILWSLVDGEMVLNTETWEKTHGFRDALLVDASRNEFKILNALAKNGGSMSRDQLQKELHLEFDIFEPWIDSAREKHLIVQKGNELQLHFQNPKFYVKPQTQLGQWFVSKTYNHAQRIPKYFSTYQIEKLAKAAFGSDFTIRSIREVALPIYTIEVLNPDGSIHTSYWNALNGMRISPRSIGYAS